MNFTADTCLKNGTCNQHCNQGRACPRLLNWQQRITPLRAKVITLSTPSGSVGRPYTGQVPYKPPPKPNITSLLSSHETLGSPIEGHAGNVRPIHPHLHARDDAWLTTPGQLARTEDEREGRAATVLEYFAIAFAVVFTVLIASVGGIAIYAMWGDAIFSSIGNAARAAWQFVTSTLLAWGRVWT